MKPKCIKCGGDPEVKSVGWGPPFYIRCIKCWRQSPMWDTERPAWVSWEDMNNWTLKEMDDLIGGTERERAKR